MKSSFGRYCGRLLATASVVAVVVAGTPMLDGVGEVSAQTKTTNAKKKGTASGTQKKTSGSKTNSPQKKSAGTQKQSSSARKGSESQSQKKPSSGGKGQSTQGKKQSASRRNSAKAPTGPKSSAEAKKLQEETQRDIRHTKEKLRLNEAEIKTGLADLSRLSSEIATGRNQVAGLQKKVAGLNGQITNLGNEITKNEAELKLMREEYLKAVKKMRLTKKNQSTLAFIFASENFNQAMRRIRYMRQFSAWKERKSADIDGKIEQLGRERESLAKAKDEQTVALGQLTKSQATLEENHKRQQALVATLRQNGDALQAHLTAKQLEANRLKETITSLIAQEQAKAEAERRAREKAEAERKAKAEAERIAREKAEAERKAAEERAAAEKAAADKAAAENALAEKVAAEKAAAERAAAEKAAAERAAAKALAEKQAAEKALAEKAAAEKKAAEKAAAEKAAAEKAAAEKEAREKAEAYKKAQEEKERADRKFAEAKAKAEEKLRKEQEKQDKKDFKESKRTARKKGDRLKNSVEVRNKAKSKDAVAVATPKTVEKTVVKETAAKVNFASLRGQLPRPVDGSWRITNAFGRHAMPEMPEIEYDNPGIDAEVAKGTTVKAVCGGKVSGVYKLSGYGNVVIVNHGDYYTVYGNLGSTNVSVGTQVGKGSALGTAGSDPDDPRRGSVHFEVWKGREKQNPSSWLR